MKHKTIFICSFLLSNLAIQAMDEDKESQGFDYYSPSSSPSCLSLSSFLFSDSDEWENLPFNLTPVPNLTDPLLEQYFNKFGCWGHGHYPPRHDWKQTTPEQALIIMAAQRGSTLSKERQRKNRFFDQKYKKRKEAESKRKKAKSRRNKAKSIKNKKNLNFYLNQAARDGVIFNHSPQFPLAPFRKRQEKKEEETKLEEKKIPTPQEKKKRKKKRRKAIESIMEKFRLDYGTRLQGQRNYEIIEEESDSENDNPNDMNFRSSKNKFRRRKEIKAGKFLQRY